jgi:hypothetical protein
MSMNYALPKHNNLFNGSAPPHLFCGWLRHLIHKPGAADRNLNKGVTERGFCNSVKPSRHCS